MHASKVIERPNIPVGYLVLWSPRAKPNPRTHTRFKSFCAAQFSPRFID